MSADRTLHVLAALRHLLRKDGLLQPHVAGPRRTAAQTRTPRHPRQLAAHRAHHAGELAAAQLLHHLLHFQVLLQQAVHVLHLHAGTGRDAAAARAIDDLGPATLARRHGIDQRDLALELLLGLTALELLRRGRAAGQLVQQAFHAAHLLQLLQLRSSGR